MILILTRISFILFCSEGVWRPRGALSGRFVALQRGGLEVFRGFSRFALVGPGA